MIDCEYFILYKSDLLIDKNKRYIVIKIWGDKEKDLILSISSYTPILFTENLELALQARDELNRRDIS